MYKPCKRQRPVKRTIQLLMIILSYIVQPNEFSSLHAQTFVHGPAPGLDCTSAALHYYIASTGEQTIQVNVWGYVKHPGCYEVSGSTNLIQLLAYTGGAVENEDISDVKITRVVKNDSLSTRDIFVHIYNSQSLEANFLQLFPGDIIYVDPTKIGR